MIAYLYGKIIKKTLRFLLVYTNGIGYRVEILPSITAGVSEGEQIKLFVHQHVREDALSLYGFKEFEQLETFELLISLSGIGPKLGLNILSTITPDDLRKAVAKTDVSVLSRIPGIGKKKASKIMLELSNKLDIEQSVSKLLFSPEDQIAIEALKKLGFKTKEAHEAIEKTGRSYTKLEDKIRAGLKYLNR